MLDRDETVRIIEAIEKDDPKDLAGSSSRNSDEPTFEPIHAEDRHTLTRLATSMSHTSGRTSSIHGMNRQDTLTQIHTGDSELDPSKPGFDLYKWLRLFMHNFDQEDVKPKRAGVVFKNLAVSGSGAALQYQQTLDGMLMAPLRLMQSLTSRKQDHRQILKNFSGSLQSGELLIVLGRPGSGCSTFLKTLCGETHGLHVDEGSDIHYNGIDRHTMMKEFKGEVVYNQEVDKHFPHLTVGQTLEFAASARTPSHRVQGTSRADYAKHVAQVVMAVFGLSHTYNTKVGNDFVRGVSGGERKRVSIAEMALAGAPLAAWDNSTRGLDSATAFKFVQSLRTLAKLSSSAHAVAIYQASQAIYDVFDKAVVLYEGRMIYYGPASNGRAFFEKQGWVCPQRQTTGDFLTAVTNPAERKAREGMEQHVPRTPDEFEKYFLESEEFAAVQRDIEKQEEAFPKNGELINTMRSQKRDAQADHTRPKSSYMTSVPMQVRLNVKRAYQRIWNDISSTAASIVMQMILALIIGSVFYGSGAATASFFAKVRTSV